MDDISTPAVDGDVVDFDAPLGEQLLDVTIRKPVPQIPAHATVMTSAGNRKPVKAERATCDRREREANFIG